MNLRFRLGSNPDLFPFSALEEQLLRFGRFGLLNATFILPIILKEIDLELKKSVESELEHEHEHEHEHEQRVNVQKLSDTFKKRFRDIAKDMYRLRYF